MPLSTSFHTSGPLQFKNDINDPLTRQLLNPRKNETEVERHTREREEREASKRSQDIDDWIERERKKKRTSKIILLGE
jgi:predicted nucleotidyltransferase